MSVGPRIRWRRQYVRPQARMQSQVLRSISTRHILPLQQPSAEPGPLQKSASVSEVSAMVSNLKALGVFSSIRQRGRELSRMLLSPSMSSVTPTTRRSSHRLSSRCCATRGGWKGTLRLKPSTSSRRPCSTAWTTSVGMGRGTGTQSQSRRRQVCSLSSHRQHSLRRSRRTITSLVSRSHSAFSSRVATRTSY